MKRYDTAEWRALSELVRNRDRRTCLKHFTLPDTRRVIFVGGCGDRFPMKHLQAAHIVPRADGGIDHPMNVVTLCRRCHGSQTASTDGGMGNPVRMGMMNAQLTREERAARTESPPVEVTEVILPGDVGLRG